MVDIFPYFYRDCKFTVKTDFEKTYSTNQLDCFVNTVIYFWNNSSNKIKNSHNVENV